MPLFDLEPSDLERRLRRAIYAEHCERLAWRTDASISTDSMIPVEAFTTRDGFASILELTPDGPLQRAWLGWAYRLSEARVNHGIRSHLVRAWRLRPWAVESPLPAQYSSRELLLRALADPERRESWTAAWLGTLQESQHAVGLLWERRRELALRAGIGELDRIESPVAEPDLWAQRLLDQSAGLASALLPRQLSGLFSAAQAENDHTAWPAQLSPRRLGELLGSPAWFEGIDVRLGNSPQPLAPSSFLRGLARLGARWADAAAARDRSWVLTHDPYGLERRTLGALFARLPLSGPWLTRVLGLDRYRAEQVRRMFLKSQLVHLRMAALSVQLRRVALGGPAQLRTLGLERWEACWGFIPARTIAGVLPRLHRDTLQRFVSLLRAASLELQLVQEFDEDWYRNPRAVEFLRSQLLLPQVCVIDDEQTAAGLARLMAELELGLA